MKNSDESTKSAEVNTPLLITRAPVTPTTTLTSNRLSVGEQKTPNENEDDKGRTGRTKSTPACIDLSKCDVGIPRLELSGKESYLITSFFK